MLTACSQTFSLRASFRPVGLEVASHILRDDANKTKLGSTDVTYVTLALEILLNDYIQRASWPLADVEKLTPS
jgi:hypothetical protein